MVALSATQQQALAIVPKFSASFSLLGSGWIIVELIFEREKRGHVYHRLLGAFATVDILESIWNFASTWPMPVGTEDVYYARGNTATCTTQGYFLQLGVALPLYNASISIYYMLAIRYNYSEEKLHRRVERWLHLVPITFAIGTSIAGLPLTLYNDANFWCWIAAHPEGCSGADCIRGDNAEIYRLAFFFIPLWCMFAVIIWALAMVYRGIFLMEQRTARYRFPALRVQEAGETPPPVRLGYWKRIVRIYPKSYAVAKQSLCYVLAFILTHIFASVNRILQENGVTSVFWISLLHVIFDPLQGFMNWVVYRRPKYIQIRKRNPELSRVQAFWRAMQWTFIERKKQARDDAPVPPPVRTAETSSARNRHIAEMMRVEAISEVDDDAMSGEDSDDGESRELSANGHADIVHGDSFQGSEAEDTN